MVSKDNTIDFTNQIFDDILNDMNVTNDGKITDTTLKTKIFKLFESEEHHNDKDDDQPPINPDPSHI